jgi:hypothetical protein
VTLAVPSPSDALERDGYVVIVDAIQESVRIAALRLLNLAIRTWGLSAEEIHQCQSTTFFPHLRWEKEIWSVLPSMAADLLGWQDGDQWTEPQILLRFPDPDEPWPLAPHVDEPPGWAAGRTYRGIIGVALSPAGPKEGAPWVWPGSHQGRRADPRAVSLGAGDALVMHPELAHSGALNLSPNVRYAVYFRLLGTSPAQPSPSA